MAQTKAEKAAKAKAKRDAAKAGLGGQAPSAPKPSKDATKVAVVDADGAVIREYSEEQHGEDFRAHADEFAGKVEGRKVVAVEEE